MISVERALAHIMETSLDLPVEEVPLGDALGLVLQEAIGADRDFPPYDRVTMDGIGIAYADWTAGVRAFEVAGIQYAGAPPQGYGGRGTCLEIMTGAVLPEGLDTVIRYEDLDIREVEGKKQAQIMAPEVSERQNVHHKGTDRQAGSQLIAPGVRISPAEVAVAATVGASTVAVKKLPRITILSSGDELVDVSDKPLPHQIRRSNSYMLQAALETMRIPSKTIHLMDDPQAIRTKLSELLVKNEVLILTGGVSKGKADYIPEALADLGVEKIFHKVQQRPGKPFWFGKKVDSSTVVFALPGNPVSSFVGFYRYIKPWLMNQMGTESDYPQTGRIGCVFYLFSRPYLLPIG